MPPGTPFFVGATHYRQAQISSNTTKTAQYADNDGQNFHEPANTDFFTRAHTSKLLKTLDKFI